MGNTRAGPTGRQQQQQSSGRRHTWQLQCTCSTELKAAGALTDCRWHLCCGLCAVARCICAGDQVPLVFLFVVRGEQLLRRVLGCLSLCVSPDRAHA